MENDILLQGFFSDWDISLNSFRKAARGFILNSPGGDEIIGLAANDYIRAKGLDVGVIGIAASAATIALIASPTRWATPHSRFLIHAPWNYAIGNGKQLKVVADDLLMESEAVLDMYLAVAPPEAHDEVRKLYENETLFDAKTALRIGLITEIKDWAGAVNDTYEGSTYDSWGWYFDQILNLNPEMSKNKSFTTLQRLMGSAAKALGVTLPQASAITASDGTELDFGTEDVTLDNIAVGQSATVNGSPASGDYTLADGRVVTFVDGVITAIADAPAAGNAEALAAALAELAQARAELSQARADLAAYKAQVAAFEKNLTAINAALTEKFGGGEGSTPASVTPPKTEKREIKIGKR